MDRMSRNSRRAARKAGHLDEQAFIKAADQFIDVANDLNQKIVATELHLAFLYASARYSAHVAKRVHDVADHEEFVTHMMRQYQEMLRRHLADESLDPET